MRPPRPLPSSLWRGGREDSTQWEDVIELPTPARYFRNPIFTERWGEGVRPGVTSSRALPLSPCMGCLVRQCVSLLGSWGIMLAGTPTSLQAARAWGWRGPLCWSAATTEREGTACSPPPLWFCSPLNTATGTA